MSIELKKHFTASLNRFTDQKLAQNNEKNGYAWPCHVISVSRSLVTVAFDVQTPFALPQVTCAISESKYVRLPIQVGDTGVAVNASAMLGGITGLGGNLASTTTPFNMAALFFIPLSSSTWPSVNPSSVVITAPNNQPIVLDAAVVQCTQNLTVANAFSGTFTTGTGQTVEVVSGIVTNIY